MGSERNWKRRTRIVNRPLQFSYMAMTIWILFNSVLITGALTYYFTLNGALSQIQVIGEIHFDPDQLVMGVTGILLKRVVPVMLLLIVLGALLDIIYLHRVAGPAYRIEKVIRDLSVGNRVLPIRLRKKDFFKDLAESVNDLARFHELRDERIRAVLQEAGRSPELAGRIEALEHLYPGLVRGRSERNGNS